MLSARLNEKICPGTRCGNSKVLRGRFFVEPGVEPLVVTRENPYFFKASKRYIVKINWREF